MSFPAFLISTVLICIAQPASADIILPATAMAVERLAANPKAFDRVDNYCTRKKPGESCHIPGNTFAGGGDGVCKNEIFSEESTIDLSCVRKGEVTIERKLPCHPPAEMTRDGEVHPPSHSEFCETMTPTPADIFCSGKEIGSTCTVELTYLGKSEQQEGVCKEKYEIMGYRHPHDPARRQIILCEPKALATHSYTPVSSWKKLIQ